MLNAVCVAASLVAVLLGGRSVFGAARAEMEPPAERAWTKIMYFGGAPGIRGVSTSWDNLLRVSPTKISLNLKDGQFFEVDTSRITSLTYAGGKRTNQGAAAVGFIAGGLLGGLLASGIKSTDHFLVLEFLLPNDRPGGLLLRLHKDSYDEIVTFLETATGLAVVSISSSQGKGR
jgi:hypothetical protein